MSNTTQSFLDLDQLVPTKAVVKLDGQDHPVEIVSVEVFIENMKLLQSVGETVTPEQEIGLIVELVSKSLPTIGKAGLLKLNLEQLRRLLEFVKANNGSEGGASEEGAEGNPQTAQ